jgi:uncharacterized membrane protein YdcZ (DUF606 family)
LSAAGYSCIETSLKKFLSRAGHVRFLVGLSSFYVTESSALRKLLSLAKVVLIILFSYIFVGLLNNRFSSFC